MAQPAWRRRPILVHPSHGSWPHRELHLSSQWRSPHGAAAPFWYTLIRFVAPPSRAHPNGAARMAPPLHIGTPLTCFVAP
eukprot:3070206-Pyramimonas_sp.AAC.1